MKTFDELKNKIAEDPSSFIVILGAGASIPAGLPSWEKLKDQLYDALSDIYDDSNGLEDAQDEINSAPNLWVAFSRLKKLLGAGRYEREIMSSLDCSKLDTPRLYRQIWELGVSGIINFNLDKFALEAYSELEHRVVDYATGIEPHKFRNFPVSTEKFVFHPHGILPDPKSWVFTMRERRNLYKDADFKNVITTLLNSKNLLILGFNVAEWSFQQLLQVCGITGKINGYNNYYFCPDTTPDKQMELEALGISVVPYKPSSAQHEELNKYLDEIINHQSTDPVLPSIYKGKVYSEKDIPDSSECYKISVDELRDILNGVVSGIIPPGTNPTLKQIDALERFYNTYITQIYRAWLIDSRHDETAFVYGYKATRIIGSGAFGSVFEVEDRDGQRYALKVLLQNVKDKISYLSCFRRGIRSMQILADKNIDGMVRIHDSYEIPACIIMDLVDGITLREAIEQRYLTRLEIKICILEQIAKIIYSAHQLEERILHRDIKPENVMLENSFSSEDFKDPSNIPNVKVLDFDLSWHRGAVGDTVMFGAVSQGFMAPEQNDSSTDRSLTRNTSVDVYSIGMLTYYVLTGVNPLSNQSQFVSFPEDLKHNLDNAYQYDWKCLPGYLTDIIVKATRADPRERISLNIFIENLSIAHSMFINHKIPNTHPLVLAEIKERLGVCTKAQALNFGRKLILEYGGLSKRVTLFTSSERSKIMLTVVIERIASESDPRNGISKYLGGIVKKAVSYVNTSIFSTTSTEVLESSAAIKMIACLPETIDSVYIKAISENILEVRSRLDN